jgi:acylphosphatase
MDARMLLKVKGRVQGVFYRHSAVEHARMLGLSGWVANESDGSVIIEAQGEKHKLESLIIWCWKGPPSARVTHVDVKWLCELDPACSGFRILR